VLFESISSKESSRRHIIRGEILQCEAIAQRFVAQQSVELFSQAGLGVMNVVLCHRAVAASCGVVGGGKQNAPKWAFDSAPKLAIVTAPKSAI